MSELSNIAGFRDVLVDAVDEVFAEEVRIAPMVNGRVDPNRQPVDIVAPLRGGAGKGSAVGGGRAWRSRIEAEKSELHIDTAKYPGLVIRGGDRVRAMQRPGKPWYEVLAVDDRGAPRTVLTLGEV